MPDLRPLHFEEIRQGAFLSRWIGESKHSVGADRAFEVGLLPVESEVALQGESLERHVEPRDLKFMVEGSLGMFVESLRERVYGAAELHAGIGEAVHVGDAATLPVQFKVGQAVHEAGAV